MASNAGESSGAARTKRRESDTGPTPTKKRKRGMSLADAVVLANNLSSKTKPAVVQAMYKSLEDGLGSCFPYGQDLLPGRVSAEFIHLAPDSLKYRVFVEKRKDQLQLERQALGVIRRKPELYCVPLKKKPVTGGGPEEDGAALIFDFMPRREEEWPKGDKQVAWWETDIHWYVIGGQHTYQACVSIAAEEEPGSDRHKFFTEFDIVPVYSKNPDLLIKVSNALNIQLKDKVVTENFRSQLQNARAKWIEKGRPLPKKAGAKHDAEFKSLVKDYLSPLFGKSVSSTTQKFPLCFVEDDTYAKWMEVFDAWEKGKINMEDGKKPDGVIPRIPLRDITMYDVERTIGLRDSDIRLLAEAILSNKVSIKSSRVAGGQRTEGVTLLEWCSNRKLQRVVMNELMAELKGFDLPSKKGDYKEYTDEDWAELAEEHDITEDAVKNIVTNLLQDNEGSRWLSRRAAPLNPSQRDTVPAPRVFYKAIQKFTDETDEGATPEPQANFQAVVAKTVKDALDSLPSLVESSEEELLILSSFSTNGKVQQLTVEDVEMIQSRLVRPVEVPALESDQSPPGSRACLLSTAFIVCDRASAMNVEIIAATNPVWMAQRILYCPKSDRRFQKTAFQSRPAVSIFIFHNRPLDTGYAFSSFSDLTGIRKDLRPYYDDDGMSVSEDWSGGKCSVSLPVLKEILLPAIKRCKGKVLNFWAGGNVTALALDEGRPVMEFVEDEVELSAAGTRVRGMSCIRRDGSCSSESDDSH